ncbi:phosphosulfolactate synthase [Methanocaldococcus fervens]|uniref:Phosphosulfolactate synthase n=1 Tax=Methanocaldococcus fervens (strain DSM 4213 / JCM 15782 / AG86) TaxID=573064 RepID=C7P5W2_METFA|nr:phosphosulfolactate synthase [Methanocaldococcus fervens]ACV23944.1 Phosphosulfolactate synthase [Methanocaldococcus fervens AG86]
MRAFEFLYKDFERGLTVVLDKGLPPKYVEDYLKVCGDYIDFVKFGWGTSAVINRDVIKEKINYYKDWDIKVYPGGTLFEYAYVKGKFDEFLDECGKLGFEAVEISDGSSDISLEKRKNAIGKAKDNGFVVLTEVGKKLPEKDKELTIEDRVKLINFDLDAGADYVIIEGRESGKGIGLFDKDGKVKEDELNVLAKNVDINKIIFEAPQKNQQVAFILKFGSSVNLANIAFDEVISLETLRRGLRGDTFGKI